MARMKWPSMEEVEAAALPDLLNWNHKLPAPAEGTDHYAALARIVARLREVQAAADAVPEADHPGWPVP